MTANKIFTYRTYEDWKSYYQYVVDIPLQSVTPETLAHIIINETDKLRPDELVNYSAF